MNEQQRTEEMHKCKTEITKTEELIKQYHIKYDQVRYKYEPFYIDIKFDLRDIIEKRREQLSNLVSKLIILKDSNVNLSHVNTEELDSFVTYCQKINLPTDKNTREHPQKPWG